MDIRWIILGTIALLIFVSMGKNPFEAPEGYQPKDPIKQSLEDRASGKTTGTGGFWGAPLPNTTQNTGGLGTSTGGFTPPPAPQWNTPTRSPTPTPPASPTQPAPFRNLPTKPEAPSSLPPGAALPAPVYVPTLTLTNGAPLRFMGQFAFTQTADGKIVPLRDGKYTMDNGITITIRDGAQEWRPVRWNN